MSLKNDKFYIYNVMEAIPAHIHNAQGITSFNRSRKLLEYRLEKQSEVSQKEKTKYHMLMHIYGI